MGKGSNKTAHQVTNKDFMERTSELFLDQKTNQKHQFNSMV